MATKLTARELAQLAAPLLAALKINDAQLEKGQKNFASLSDEAIAGAYTLYLATEDFLEAKYPPEPMQPGAMVTL